MSAASDRTALFTAHRSYLFAVAYRMLGSAEDAEDMLQDAWLRFADTEPGKLEHPRTYLVTIVTRLCIDFLRSARQRREEYVGVWLPEPVPTREALPEDLLQQTESASFAFLLLLERLEPLQRAVLVLHDVFDFTHAEIGRAIERTPAASRQILRRARLALGKEPRSSLPAPNSQQLIGQFLAATRDGNLEALLGALAPDVVLMSDGGGKVTAVNRPLAGSTPVGRFFAGLARNNPWVDVELTELNARPAVLVSEQGTLTNAMLFDVTNAGVTAIYVVRNPDKLRRLATSQRAP